MLSRKEVIELYYAYRASAGIVGNAHDYVKLKRLVGTFTHIKLSEMEAAKDQFVNVHGFCNVNFKLTTPAGYGWFAGSNYILYGSNAGYNQVRYYVDDQVEVQTLWGKVFKRDISIWSKDQIGSTAGNNAIYIEFDGYQVVAGTAEDNDNDLLNESVGGAAAIVEDTEQIPHEM